MFFFPKTDANSKSWYGGGQAYGDVNIDGYMDYLVSVNNDENNVELKWFINTGNNYNPNKFALELFKFFKGLGLQTSREIKGSTIFVTVK